MEMKNTIPIGRCQCGCGAVTPLATRTQPGLIKGQPTRFLTGHHRRIPDPPRYKGPIKLCECGCGQPAPLAKETRQDRGLIKGHPTRFINGHSGVLVENKPRGSRHPRWKGGVQHKPNGYTRVLAPEHPWADQTGYVSEHVVVAERALGHILPFQSRVHHVNEVRSDNRGANLVICEDHAYHMLLHQRTRAYRACGDPTAVKCKYCHQWDRYSGGDRYAHKTCKATADAARWQRNKAEGKLS